MAVPGDETSKIHQQKLKVVYLPADGVLPEEDEPEANLSSLYTQDGNSVCRVDRMSISVHIPHIYADVRH